MTTAQMEARRRDIVREAVAQGGGGQVDRTVFDALKLGLAARRGAGGMIDPEQRKARAREQATKARRRKARVTLANLENAANWCRTSAARAQSTEDRAMWEHRSALADRIIADYRHSHAAALGDEG